ncbi:MAG: hypothetical protein C4526_10265 [Nitrospiraceae bacterium]|nr:MAG: hypothetical protein C4526_10265 [Nitrospiraceae bacterium]
MKNSDNLRKEAYMKKFLKKLETVYAAAAFAEAGEFETAREMLKEEKRIKKRDIAKPRPRKQLRAD